MFAWPLRRPPALESCDDYRRKGCSQGRKTGRPEDPGSVLPLAPCRGVHHRRSSRVPADPAAAAAASPRPRRSIHSSCGENKSTVSWQNHRSQNSAGRAPPGARSASACYVLLHVKTLPHYMIGPPPKKKKLDGFVMCETGP